MIGQKCNLGTGKCGVDKRVLIEKAPETHIYPLGEEEFSDAVENRYFYENTNAPSFLKMLGGDFSADINGISSFVNTEVYSQTDVSNTDYSFFGSEDSCPLGNYFVAGGYENKYLGLYWSMVLSNILSSRMACSLTSSFSSSSFFL